MASPYGSTRITQEVIRSGQPRAYADTERVVRLYFERVPYQGTGWVPDEAYPKASVRRAAKALVGWTYDRDDPARAGFSEHFSTYLDYLRPVATGVWELRVVTPFTD